MDILTKCTLKEIELVEQHMNLSSTSENKIRVTNEVADQLMHDLNEEVWNNKNIEKCTQYFNRENDTSAAYLWGNPDLTDINTYAGKYSFYLDEIILDEPLTVRLLQNPFYSHEDRLSIIEETISGLIEAKEWLEAGIVKMLPVSSKMWFENNEAKKYMTEVYPKYGNDEFKFIKEETSIHDKFMQALSVDDFILEDNLMLHDVYNAMIEGQVLEIEQSIYFSQFLNLIPTVTDFDQWNVLNWRLEKENRAISKEWTNTFALKNLELHYLDNLPVDIALKIRDGGYGAELRSFFRDKFSDVHSAQDITEFNSITSDISSEIKDEIKIYEKDISNLKDTYLNIGGKTTIGLMGVALGAYFGQPLDTLLALATGISYLSVDEFLRLKNKQNNCLNLLLEAKNHSK
ncbi:hypothetical protein [uncultured Methanolobus sp.]|uniref:hypothetical protein n=1 Tax=uncultured Methanolobus sp. TaxID=218300 RepID=UPI0029C70281|nr:hypothetical protein [uncultured Methanolobus sp.]